MPNSRGELYAKLGSGICAIVIGVFLPFHSWWLMAASIILIFTGVFVALFAARDLIETRGH